MPERTLGDPTPRTLESLTQAMKAIEEKTRIQFEAQQEAVRLLQDFSNRQPTTEAVNGDVKALKELTSEHFAALRELMNAKFDGNKTALDAALKTQKEASDKIEANFTKQFESIANIVEAKTKALDEKIGDNKDRITSSESHSKGLGDGWVILVGAVGILGILASIVTAILART